MSAPEPRNPKGAGRKPTPAPNKKMQSFWCDADIAQELENWNQYGFQTKSAMINFALRNLIQT
jgi:hypothetical protein